MPMKMRTLCGTILAAVFVASVAFGQSDAAVSVLGYQLDISRCKVPTMETLHRVVDILAKLGYNHFEL